MINAVYMRRVLWVSLTMLVVVHTPARARADDPSRPYRVERIWDEAPHNAFTDLIRLEGRFYCTFREGRGHVPGTASGDGKIRVIVSDDAEDWRSVALLAEDGIDLRDPKLSVTPDSRLMLLMGGSDYRDGKLHGQRSRVAFSNQGGTEWSSTQPIVLDEKIATEHDWLWRVTWHDKTAYGVVYQSSGGQSHAQLVKSDDGVHYEHVTDLGLDGRPNEATIRFRAGGEMLLVIRREAAGQRGMLGHSTPPYTAWTWHEMSHRLGGPNFVILEDGELILATRKYAPGGATTIIASLAKDGTVTELVELRSGGDTSYPGMLVHEGTLFVSYYSSHEEKTAIYLAKIRLDALHRSR
jgi:hypothetical protein